MKYLVSCKFHFLEGVVTSTWPGNMFSILNCENIQFMSTGIRNTHGFSNVKIKTETRENSPGVFQDTFDFSCTSSKIHK